MNLCLSYAQHSQELPTPYWKRPKEALHNHDYQSILDGIEQRHYEMIKEILPVSVQNPLLMLVKGNFNILEDLLSSVAHLGELSDRTKAKLFHWASSYPAQL